MAEQHASSRTRVSGSRAQRRTAAPSSAAPTRSVLAQSGGAALLDWMLSMVLVPWRRWVLVLLIGAVLGGLAHTQDLGLYVFGFAALDIVVSSIYLLVRRLWRAGRRTKTNCERPTQ